MKQVLRTLVAANPGVPWVDLYVLVELAINCASIANTEYSPFYLNYGYYPVFWWDFPDQRGPMGLVARTSLRLFIQNMKVEWHLVLQAFEKERKKAALYSNRKRADYTFKVGQDELISKRKHYRGSMATQGCLWHQRQLDLLPLYRKWQRIVTGLDIPEHIRGPAYPVFHSCNLILGMPPD